MGAGGDEEIKLVFTTEDSQMLRSMVAHQAEIVKTLDKWNRTAEAVDKVGGSAQQMDREVRSALQGIQTPLERNAERLAKIDEWLVKGKIDYSQSIALARQYNAELARATAPKGDPVADRRRAELDALKQAHRSPQERHRDAIATLDAKLKDGLDPETHARAVGAEDKRLADSLRDPVKLTAYNRALSESKTLTEQLQHATRRHADTVAELNRQLAAKTLTPESHARLMGAEETRFGQEKVDMAQADTNRKRQEGIAITKRLQGASAEYRAEVKRLNQLHREGHITEEIRNKGLKEQADLLRQSEAGSRGSAAGVLSLVGSLAGVTSVVGAITMGVRALVQEYEHMHEVNKSAADKQVDVAGARREALGAQGATPQISQTELDARIGRMATARGVPSKDLYAGSAEVFSARGDLSESQALESLDAAARTSPHDGQQMSELAGANLDLRKRNPKASASQIQGLIIGANQASRVKNLGQFARNIVPTISNLQAYGDSASEAAALTAMLSEGMVDTRGEMTGTAAIQLAEQLNKALPEAKTGLKTTTERIKFLQAGSARAKTVFKRMFGTDRRPGGTFDAEKKALPTLRGLLRGDEHERKLYDAAVDAVPTLENAEPVYERTLARMGSGEIEKTAAQARKSTVNQERIELANTRGAQYETARQEALGALDKSGEGVLSRMYRWALFQTNQIGASTRNAVGADGVVTRRRDHFQNMVLPNEMRKRAQALRDEGKNVEADNLERSANHVDNSDPEFGPQWSAEVLPTRPFEKPAKPEPTRAPFEPPSGPVSELRGARKPAAAGIPTRSPIAADPMPAEPRAETRSPAASRPAAPAALAIDTSRLEKVMEENTRATRENTLRAKESSPTSSPPRPVSRIPTGEGLGRDRR